MPASTSGTKSPFCINTNQLSIVVILRPRPRTCASTSPLLLLQLHQQQQLISINIIDSTNHLQHAILRMLLQHLTSHAAYERSGGPPKRPAAKRPCIHVQNCSCCSELSAYLKGEFEPFLRYLTMGDTCRSATPSSR